MKYNIVITAGGTSEKIDNVRKITNNASGKLGSMIANCLLTNHKKNINKIFYICSSTSYKPNFDTQKCKIIEICDTNDLKATVENLLTTKKIDYFIHSMAVSDYTVDYITTSNDLAKEIDINNIEKSILNFKKGLTDTKISSNKDNLIIKLKQTPKIIKIIKKISPQTKLVGFKLLDNVKKSTLFGYAKNLMQKNDCDLVVANDQKNISKNNHKAYILQKDMSYKTADTKEEIAKTLCEEIFSIKNPSAH